ncbi:MAG: NADPH-dependent FMN reductase [Polyangiaceae bacterium]|nr:NADPH-dependent FMN reductase [Polyangiaceae bacterium]
MVDVRKGQYPGRLDRAAFRRRYLERFVDPAFDGERDAIDRLEAIAYDAYCRGRKAPLTRPAGPGFADPSYELSEDWRASRAAVLSAAERHAAPDGPVRVLVIVGSSRNDGTCPGEMSKTYRLVEVAMDAIAADGGAADRLDLSRLVSEPLLHIHPCKACVSTAMPLCHWPCSCYPNHATGQTGDAMAEIYPLWVAAHGVLIVAPVYWGEAPSPLKLMMDRLVCADGGNPDPTTTQGKDAARAKALELDGWSYPKHLAGRAFGLIVHGDVSGASALRTSLHDWLTWMGLVPSGALGEIERYVGYFEPYATSHQALDRDRAIQEEARNAGRAVVRAARAVREGVLRQPDAALTPPRKK